MIKLYVTSLCKVREYEASLEVAIIMKIEITTASPKDYVIGI
jgi:hypothetical protein